VKWFLDRGVTHRVKPVWLSSKNRVLAVSTLSCSEVLILMLDIWAIMSIMPGLSTIVTQMRWKLSGLEICCWAFLIRRSLFFLFFLNLAARERVALTGSCVALLVSHLRLLSRGRVSVQVISHSLTSISDNTHLLPRSALSSSL
jgi:hypothetical protein